MAQRNHPHETRRAAYLTFALVALALASCRGTGGLGGPPRLALESQVRAATGATGPVRLVRTPGCESVSVDEAAAELADADVVFLGEQHDSPEGHAVQLALTRALAARRGELILSMEMLERDAQRRLDLYLEGVIDEERFRAGTRLWPNYEAHYRGAVEFARENGFEVVAGNVFRPIAARVARGGVQQSVGDPWAARSVDTSGGEYRRRFDAVMGGSHSAESEVLDRVYAAQCVKDDTMAESIARALDRRGPDAPIVVHWCGRFHSDFGLGTVERLQRRKPGLNIAVVSMLTVDDIHRDLTSEERDQGHFVVIAPTPAD